MKQAVSDLSHQHIIYLFGGILEISGSQYNIN